MTEAALIAIVTIIPAALASIVTIIIGWMNNRQGNKIHTLVNSNMTAVKAELATAQEQIASLQSLVAKTATINVPASVIVGQKDTE